MNNRLGFIGIEVSYPPPEGCCYPEYKGKPYFAIKYKEDGQYMVGFGTYNPEVLSRYIKEYFIKPMNKSDESERMELYIANHQIPDDESEKSRLIKYLFNIYIAQEIP